MEIFKIIDATIISPPRAIIIIVMIAVYRGQETGIIVGDVMIFLRPSPPPPLLTRRHHKEQPCFEPIRTRYSTVRWLRAARSGRQDWKGVIMLPIVEHLIVVNCLIVVKCLFLAHNVENEYLTTC